MLEHSTEEPNERLLFSIKQKQSQKNRSDNLSHVN